MSANEKKAPSLQEELTVVIADLEALADEIQRAMDHVALESDADESISHLKRAKAAALRGTDLTRRKLDSI